jgi:nucleotide-binding universal stress UspA family protein
MIPFRTILVAADLSESSRQAFTLACSLAHEHKTRIFVLNVIEPKYVADGPVYLGQQAVRYIRVVRDPSEHESLKERLREVYVPDQPLDVEYQTREGNAAEEILRSSKDLGCNLIVMGTHGRTGLRRLLAGSIAETVLREARCPVLALRCSDVQPAREPIPTILHPTDFSECSESALQIARSLARDHGARLILLHVSPFEVFLEGTMTTVEDPRVDQDSLEKLRRRLDGPDLKYPVEVRLNRGDATTEIARVAGELDCGLIVMGTHGWTGIDRFLMDSVAEATLRKAPCPVLAVKAPQQERAWTPDRQIEDAVTLH